jgi:chemotaxis regulatin CheY-phosphate phosphatase CheZ
MTTSIDQATQAVRDQIETMIKGLNLENIDIPTLIENQKRNIDAMSKAAQLTTEAATDISHRQLQIFGVASEQLAASLKDLKISDDQRREIATKAFENASARAEEVAEMSAKANREMFETTKQCMTDNFNQIREMFPALRDRA